MQRVAGSVIKGVCTLEGLLRNSGSESFRGQVAGGGFRVCPERRSVHHSTNPFYHFDWRVPGCVDCVLSVMFNACRTILAEERGANVVHWSICEFITRLRVHATAYAGCRRV